MPQLLQVRSSLLILHRFLLESERAAYEQAHRIVTSKGQFLGLLLGDPWFAWLRPYTTLIVGMDEALEGQELTSERVEELVREAARLTETAGDDEPHARYRSALERHPQARDAHAALRQVLETQ